MTDKKPKDREMRGAEDIMSEDREILHALASTNPADSLAVARDVMKRRQSALKKLAE